MINIEKILVPVSFAPSNEKALEMASRIAGAFKAKLYILNVYKTLPRLFYNVGGNFFSKSMVQEREEKIEALDKFINTEKKRLELSLDVEEIETENKDPIETILSVAKEKNIDLIVLGHHEESKLEHFLFGRNINKIVDGAPCDVIVTRTQLYASRSSELSAA
jgi:nucleotide-binding universal stress UspA family protein